ncbi:MAG: hypothetical protein NT011_13560 [Kiritimatiellaeota bacterium]|nr:hypothetical protein [Kiritimatiellota bacterium]
MNDAISPAPRSSVRKPNGFSSAGGSVVGSALSLAPLVLAQAPGVGATELGMWLLAGAALTVMANQGFSFFKNLTGGFARKQPKNGEKLLTTEDCDKKHAAIAEVENQKHAAITEEIKAIRTEWKSDRKDMHTRIDDVAINVAFIRGKFEGK